MGHTAHGAASGSLLCRLVPVSNALQPPPSPAAVAVLRLHFSLTPRQGEVLHWIAEGKTNAEIAIILDCSFSTVKKHVAGIFQRLCVHTRTAAAACAYRAHIAEADPRRASAQSAASP